MATGFPITFNSENVADQHAPLQLYQVF